MRRTRQEKANVIVLIGRNMRHDILPEIRREEAAATNNLIAARRVLFDNDLKLHTPVRVGQQRSVEIPRDNQIRVLVARVE